MIGFFLRVGVLLALVYIVAQRMTRAWRLSAYSTAIGHIQEEVRMLKAGLEAGIYSDREYSERKERIRALCMRQGIAIPELPAHIIPSDNDLGS